MQGNFYLIYRGKICIRIANLPGMEVKSNNNTIKRNGNHQMKSIVRLLWPRCEEADRLNVWRSVCEARWQHGSGTKKPAQRALKKINTAQPGFLLIWRDLLLFTPPSPPKHRSRILAICWPLRQRQRRGEIICGLEVKGVESVAASCIRTCNLLDSPV